MIYMIILICLAYIVLTVPIYIIQYVLLTRKEKKGVQFNPTNVRSLDDLIDILHFTIEKQIAFRLDIEYAIKRSSKIITDYGGELTTISKSIVNAFAPTYLNELKYYYTEEYILEYCVKMVQIHILKYMNDNKIKTK